MPIIIHPIQIKIDKLFKLNNILHKIERENQKLKLHPK